MRPKSKLGNPFLNAQLDFKNKLTKIKKKMLKFKALNLINAHICQSFSLYLYLSGNNKNALKFCCYKIYLFCYLIKCITVWHIFFNVRVF